MLSQGECCTERDSQQLCDPLRRPLQKQSSVPSHSSFVCCNAFFFFFFPCSDFFFLNVYEKEPDLLHRVFSSLLHLLPSTPSQLSLLIFVSTHLFCRVQVLFSGWSWSDFCPFSPPSEWAFPFKVVGSPGSFTPLSRKGIRKDTSYYHFPQHVPRDALAQLRSDIYHCCWVFQPLASMSEKALLSLNVNISWAAAQNKSLKFTSKQLRWNTSYQRTSDHLIWKDLPLSTSKFAKNAWTLRLIPVTLSFLQSILVTLLTAPHFSLRLTLLSLSYYTSQPHTLACVPLPKSPPGQQPGCLTRDHLCVTVYYRCHGVMTATKLVQSTRAPSSGLPEILCPATQWTWKHWCMITKIFAWDIFRENIAIIVLLPFGNTK